MNTAIGLIKQTFEDWIEDKAPRLGAALAYYAIFSIPPFMLLVVATLQVFYAGNVTAAVERQVGMLVGQETGASVMQILEASVPANGIGSGVFGLGLLLFGASGLFGQLQDAMNTIWEVKPKEGRGVLGILKDRFLSFTMVLGTGFLLLVSLILTAAVSVFASQLPGAAALGQIAESGISFVVIALLFAMIFKILPDVKIDWGDVWIGAIVTAILFVLGKALIGVYLAKGAIASSYGAAGPLIMILIWVYYSAQILFLGAEFTQVYANRYGSRVVPADNAEPVSGEKRAQEGLTREKKTRTAS